MKKALKKTIMIAALLFCSNLAHAKVNDITKQKKVQADQIIFNSKISKSLNKHQLTPMLALQNSGNLRAYHVGSKFFNPLHKVPTAKDLHDSVKSHPFFIGRLVKEPSHEEYVNLKAKISHPFFILETYQNGKSDFYMVHSMGVRHFVINVQNDRQDNLASIDNSAKDYPDIESFIECTLS